MPRRAAVLAIDGGNSKTDVALVAADGTVLAEARGAGTDPQRTGLGPAMRSFGSLVTATARKAGLATARADGPAAAAGPVASHLSACLANVDLPEEEQQVGEALAGQGWSLTTALVNDTFAVLRAGLDGSARGQDAGRRWGVAVTCGAGINCVGIAPDGRTARFLALGVETGDWGGGYGLGLTALWWAMRADDGRGPQTALREALPGHFGLAEVRDVAIGIHTGAISRDRLRGLTPVLFEVAASGDAVARNIVLRQAEEVCAMALATIRKLGLAGTDVRVVLGGGVLAARDPLLTGSIRERLAAAAPGAVMRITDVPPVAGAALLGLDHAGASPAAEERLRAAYLSQAARA